MGLHTPIETHRTQPPLGVEILDLRHFSSHSLRELLEHETLLWAQMMSWDYRPSAEMILRYIDRPKRLCSRKNSLRLVVKRENC